MGINSNLPCSIEDVVDLVGIHVVRNTGTQLHCRCPFCNDTKAHLNVKLEKNVFRCNRCGKGGGILHLYAAAHDISLNAAYDELCRIFASNGKRPSGSGTMKPVVVNPEQPIADAATRNNTYGNLLSLLSLGASHRESLLLRGLSGDDIVRLGYKTTPAVRSARIVTELLNRGCELEGVPGFFRDQDTGAWKLDIRASGIMLPDRNSKGEIEAIQIRLDKVYKSKFNKGTLSFEMNGVIQTRNSNLEIDQTFLNIKVRLRTNESASQVIRASVEEIHNEKQLLYMYINEPKAELRSKSPMHYGTAMLRVVSPEKISGNYYTDRLTRGSMEFTAE